MVASDGAFCFSGSSTSMPYGLPSQCSSIHFISTSRVSGVNATPPSTPKPPARLTAATTSRQWLNANRGNSTPHSSWIVFMRRTIDASDLECATPLESTAEGDLVGVLEVATDRQAAGETSDAQPHRLDQPGEVRRGRLTLEVGVSGDDQLRDIACEARHQLADAQVVRTDTLNGRDRAAQHVVAATELTRALDSDDVLGLFDHADDRRVATWVAADAALVAFRDVAADDAEADLVLHLGERGDQPSYVDRVCGEQVERDPLRALGTDARQPPELVDEVLDRAFIHLERQPGHPAAESAGKRPHLLLRQVRCVVRRVAQIGRT